MTDGYMEALSAICRPVRANAFPRSLAPMMRLLEVTGCPQDRYLRVLVAGSVGKGTAALRTARWLEAAGLRVGLYTGPHLHSFRERFAVNGQTIRREDFVRMWEQVRRAVDQTGDDFSTFELATALALIWFAQEGVAVAVLEAGMGGRWDAVNTARAPYSLITPIESEHAAMLGGSLQTIAYHKAGTMPPGGRVASVRQSDVVADVLLMEARRRGARLEWAEYEALPEVVGGWLMEEGLITGQPDSRDWTIATLPGRLEHIQAAGRLVIIDGGHTCLAGRRLRVVLDEHGASEPVGLVVGMLKDKAVTDYLSAFDDPCFHLILTRAPGHRGIPAGELRRKSGLTAASVETEQDPRGAMARALDFSDGLIAVGGSLRMAALAREAMGLLSADELEEARLTRAIFEGEGYLARLGNGG